MKLNIVKNQSEGNVAEQIEALGKYFELVGPDTAEMYLCMTIFSMDDTRWYVHQFKKPYAVYCWDYYLWAHEGRGGTYLDWKKYVSFMKGAKVVFVPSRTQQRRLEELLNIKSVVVHTGIKTYGEMKVHDSDYILAPVRHYPESNADWHERAASELGILMVHSEHKYSFEEFKGLVANCSFMTCPYIEASTGGLTLMEGLALGKASLISDSPYMGARDYVGDFGIYFKHDSYEDYRDKMKQLWTNRPKVDIIKAREHVASFSFERMAEQIHKHLCELA